LNAPNDVQAAVRTDAALQGDTLEVKLPVRSAVVLALS